MKILTDEILTSATNRLESLHWDGNGCGTHGNAGCGHCYGPSPMSAEDVAFEVLNRALPEVSARIRIDLVTTLHGEKALHDGPIWKAAMDRCIELIDTWEPEPRIPSF